MARYDEYLNVRIDPVVYHAIEKLATKWGLKQAHEVLKNEPIKRRRRGRSPLRRGYVSEVVRRAIVFAYLVDVLKVDPREAPDKAIEYMNREIEKYYIYGGRV